MLQFLDLGSDNVWAVHVVGKLDSDDIAVAMATLDERLSRPENVRCYFEAEEMDGVTIGAMLKDVLYGLRHVGDVPRFERFAIVADQPWLHALAKFEDKLLIGVEVRAFPPEQRAAARDWITEED
ncbi:MAG: STAS/SEC14 domain-containing protein [Gemmatimonadota bacterium]